MDRLYEKRDEEPISWICGRAGLTGQDLSRVAPNEEVAGSFLFSF